jgi:RNA polymerase sigma factor (sigma-70 family)
MAVRTHCTRLARRSLRHVLSGDPTPIALEGPSTEDQLVDHQLRHRLAWIVSELEPDLRDVLLRRDVLGQSTRQAAEALGLSSQALKSRLHRARAEVKQRLLASLHGAAPPARGMSIV